MSEGIRGMEKFIKVEVVVRAVAHVLSPYDR
jgi:hypothetical protein